MSRTEVYTPAAGARHGSRVGRPPYTPGRRCLWCQLSPLSKTPTHTPTPLSGWPGHSPTPFTQLPASSPSPGTEPQGHRGQLPLPAGDGTCRSTQLQKDKATRSRPTARGHQLVLSAVIHLFTPTLCGALWTPSVRPRLPEVAGGGGMLDVSLASPTPATTKVIFSAKIHKVQTASV